MCSVSVPEDPEGGQLRLIDADRIGQAAVDIGVAVPPGLLIAVTKDGKHLAMTAGKAADFRAAAGILSRLDGRPVSECMLGFDGSETGPEPEWLPPDDFFENPEAQRVYLEEYARHPEWPRFYNSAADVLELVRAAAPWLGSGAPAGLIFRELLRQHGETKRTRIIQEHETARALIRQTTKVNEPSDKPDAAV